MTSTHNTLTDEHGVLMTLEQLAKLLHRRPNGLRVALQQNTHFWAKRINASKCKIGRRVLFRTADIAQIIDAEPPKKMQNKRTKYEH